MNNLFNILFGGQYPQRYDNQGYYDQGYYDQGYYDQGYYDQGYYDQGYNNQGYNNQGYNNQGINNQGYNNQGINNNKKGSNKILSFICICICIFFIMGAISSIAYYYKFGDSVAEEKLKVKDETKKDTISDILARIAARPPPPPPPPPKHWENNDPKLWILEDSGNIIEIKKKTDFDINEPYYEMIINKNLNNTNNETILFNEISMTGKGYAWGISKDDKLYNCLKPCGSPIIKTIINPTSNKTNFDNEDLQLSEEECKKYSEKHNYNYKKRPFASQPSCFIEKYTEPQTLNVGNLPVPGEDNSGEPKNTRDTVIFNSIYPTKDQNFDTDNRCTGSGYTCLQKKFESPPSGNSIYEWKEVKGPHNRKGFKNITCDEFKVYLRDENNIVWSNFIDGTKTWMKMPGDYPKYISGSNPTQLVGIKSDDKYMYCNKPCSGSTPWTESSNINYIKVHGSRNGIYAMEKTTNEPLEGSQSINSGGNISVKKNIIHYKDTDNSQWQILKDNATGENLNCKDISSSKGTFFCLTNNRIKYCKEPYDGNFKWMDTIGTNIKQITASSNGWAIKLKENAKFSGNKIKDTTAYSELNSVINECDKLSDCVGINYIKNKYYLMPISRVVESKNNFSYKIVESGTPDKSLQDIQCKIYGKIQNDEDITIINDNNAPFGCLQKEDIYYYNKAETLIDPNASKKSSTTTDTTNRTVVKDAKKNATVGVAYTYTATTSDDTTLTGTTIPSWLTFTPSSGNLYGTPTNSDIGSHDVIITASKSGGSSDDSFKIKVSDEDDGEAEVNVTESELDPDRDKECGYDNWKCIEKDPYTVSIISKPDAPKCGSEPCYQGNKWTKDYEVVSTSIGEIYNNSYNAIKTCENNQKCMGINYYKYGKNFDNNQEYYLKEYNYPCCKKNETVEQCSLNNSTSDRRNATTQEECKNANGEWFPENVIKKKNTKTSMWIKNLNEIDQERKKNEIPEVITQETYYCSASNDFSADAGGDKPPPNEQLGTFSSISADDCVEQCKQQYGTRKGHTCQLGNYR
jgi:hypothetical protein